MNIIELAKKAELPCQHPDWIEGYERFAALVRADLMKQVMDTCEAEYDKYDKMIVEDDMGHDEAVAMIHLMRKLDRLRPATGKAEREWVDLMDEDIEQAFVNYGCDQKPIPADFDISRAVIAAFKEKNK